MIVRLPSKLCKKCGGKGFVRKETKLINIFVLVCSCITKSRKRETMTLKQFNKRINKLNKNIRKKLKSEKA